MPEQKSHFYTNPYLLLTLTALFWSGNMVLGRGIRADVPPLALAFWRWAIAFALVLPLAAPHFRSQWPLLTKGWKPVLFLGLLGVGGYNTFAYIALQYTSATNAVLLNSFIPVATIAISWAFLGKHLRRLEGLGVVISLCGALTIVARGDPAVLAHLNLNLGDAWMLLAVLVWAVYTVGLAWRPAGVHPMLMLAAMTAVGLAALLPAYLWEMAQGRHINVQHRFARRARLCRHFPQLPRLHLLQPRRGGNRRQQGQPVHPPDAGVRHAALGAVPRRNTALVSLPRHRPDLHRHLADDEKVMGLLDWLGDRRKSAVPDALWAKTVGALPFLVGARGQRAKRAQIAGRGLPGRKGIQRRRRP